MTVSVNEYENIKREALYGDETKKILEDFDREKRLSKKALGTRYIYWKCIRNFFFYLAKQRRMKIIDLETLTKDDIADFLDNCGYADTTVNTHKITIKIVYNLKF